jgi:penicillin-binding protein 1C
MRAAAVSTALMALTVGAVYFVIPPPSLFRGRSASTLVLAADASILRGFLTTDGKWRLPVEPGAVDPLYRRMLIAAEDQRFCWHRGVDPVAAARALFQFGSTGHIVSGASTLTMQTVRLLEPHPRSFIGKLREVAQALALER